MGCTISKNKMGQRIRDMDNKEEENTERDAAVSDSALIRKYDEENIRVIKRDLDKNPDLFVLNNVLMCTMFLKNYHEDLTEATKKIQNSNKGFIEPDVLMEIANRNVIYRPMHGPKKESSEPLVTRKIYVPLNDTVEVVQNDNCNCTSNKDYRFQVKMEESKRKGFIKLREVKGSHRDQNSMKDILPSPSTSGTSDTESSDYASNETDSKTTPQPIRDNANENFVLNDCFVFRKVKKPDIDIEIEDLDHEHLSDEDVYDIASYLTSRRFMKYFQSKIFPENIAKQLGFDQSEIDNATSIPGRIFCNENEFPCQVLPCLRIPWPERQTVKFLIRPEDESFHWPTLNMLNEISRSDCVLIPKGYSRKLGEYPEGDLEWEIHFPFAERYMQSLLRPEQIDCYLILLTLYKEYIEPYTKQHGVTPEHLKTLIFWETENNFHDWPKHRLGVKLVNIIQNLTFALSKRTLYDYFVDQKNLFKTVSRGHLEYANEVFHRIAQSPLMLIVRALRNLRYTSGRFYPSLDYKRLLEILYKNDWEMENEYLGIDNVILANRDNISQSSSALDRKPKYTDVEKQLMYVKEKERKRRMLQKRMKKKQVKKVEHIFYNVNTHIRRDSEDTIDENWDGTKPFEKPKKIALLKFFINNYIDLAKTSSRISTTKQTLFYLKQAWYLASILYQENRLFEDEVAQLFLRIRKEEIECLNGNSGQFVRLTSKINTTQNENQNKLLKTANSELTSSKNNARHLNRSFSTPNLY